jgi:hypothetical protein
MPGAERDELRLFRVDVAAHEENFARPTRVQGGRIFHPCSGRDRYGSACLECYRFSNGTAMTGGMPASVTALLSVRQP